MKHKEVFNQYTTALLGASAGCSKRSLSSLPGLGVAKSRVEGMLNRMSNSKALTNVWQTEIMSSKNVVVVALFVPG